MATAPLDGPGPTLMANKAAAGSLIAQSLQDRDFEPLHEGEPMFVRPDGTTIAYDGAHWPVVHPVFVNEAAYYLAQSGRGVGLTTIADWPIEAACADDST